MSCFEEFLETLFHEGRVIFRCRPEPERAISAAAIDVLKQAYEAFRLDVAGPVIPLNLEVAYETAELVRQACWAR